MAFDPAAWATCRPVVGHLTLQRISDAAKPPRSVVGAKGRFCSSAKGEIYSLFLSSGGRHLLQVFLARL